MRLLTTALVLYLLMQLNPMQEAQQKWSRRSGLAQSTNVQFVNQFGKVWLKWDAGGKEVWVEFQHVIAWNQEIDIDHSVKIYTPAGPFRTRITERQINAAWALHQESEKQKKRGK